MSSKDICHKSTCYRFQEGICILRVLAVEVKLIIKLLSNIDAAFLLYRFSGYKVVTV